MILYTRFCCGFFLLVRERNFITVIYYCNCSLLLLTACAGRAVRSSRGRFLCTQHFRRDVFVVTSAQITSTHFCSNFVHSPCMLQSLLLSSSVAIPSTHLFDVPPPPSPSQVEMNSGSTRRPEKSSHASSLRLDC